MELTLPSEGGCQCNEIRYRIVGEPVWLTVCHCNECKRQSGAAFGMSLRMHAADVELISGEAKRWTRLSDSASLVICHFCGTCGTRLWHEPAGSGYLHIKPGTLDDPSQLAPRFEAWTKRKAPWLAIDGLKASFTGQPPSGSPQTGTYDTARWGAVARRDRWLKRRRLAARRSSAQPARAACQRSTILRAWFRSGSIA
jgi:hypothetical protein